MKKNNFGFTLIELMVAITIGMLVVGVGSVALNNFSEKQKVEAVRQELLANLRSARNYAITEQFGEDPRDGTDRVAVTIDSNGLMIIKAQWLNKETKEVRDTDPTFYSKDITPNNVWITADKNISFSITDGRSIYGAVNIGISGTVEKNIIIDESGLIYEE